MFSILLQRNNSAEQEGDDGHRVLSCFTECQSNLSSTFPKTVLILVLALLVSNQTPHSSSTEYCDSVKPDSLNTVLQQHRRCLSAQHPLQAAPQRTRV